MKPINENSLKKMERNYKPYLISALVAAVVSLLFYPIQKNVDYKYWLKQEKLSKEERLFERKLELIDEFSATFLSYSHCSWKSSANFMGEIYIPENVDCTQYNRAQLESILQQAELFFGETIGTNLSIFNEHYAEYGDYVGRAYAGEIPPDEEDPKFLEFFYSHLSLQEQAEKLTEAMYSELSDN